MEKIHEAISDINEKLFKKTGIPQFWLRYIEDGYEEAVQLMLQGFQMNIEIDLWNSENEEREWIEEKNDYEDFEVFLERKVQDCLHLFTELKSIL